MLMGLIFLMARLKYEVKPEFEVIFNIFLFVIYFSNLSPNANLKPFVSSFAKCTIWLQTFAVFPFIHTRKRSTKRSTLRQSCNDN
jgi:hypothetical protein